MQKNASQSVSYQKQSAVSAKDKIIYQSNVSRKEEKAKVDVYMLEVLFPTTVKWLQ